MRAVAETSYRADVAFCVMTLLAALVIACDTGGAGSSSPAGIDAEISAQPIAQVTEQHPEATARSSAASASAASPANAVTRR